MLHSRNFSSLAPITALRRLSQSLAMLDAILCPQWQYRYYSFDAHWANNEMMASMQNGSGDEYFLLFSKTGAIIKGFVQNSKMSSHRTEPPQCWPGVLEEVPVEFTSSFLQEPAFSIQAISFCIWNTVSNSGWRIGSIQFPEGDDPDGSKQLLSILDGNPETYLNWAESYYERKISLEGVKLIYQHHPITPSLLELFSPDMKLEALLADVEAIDYPFVRFSLPRS